MPKEERKKGTHLTWDDRHEIQKGLKEHRTFKEIAYIIGCSPDTVSKEIRRHRYHKLRSRDGILHASPNRCAITAPSPSAVCLISTCITLIMPIRSTVKRLGNPDRE